MHWHNLNLRWETMFRAEHVILFYKKSSFHQFHISFAFIYHYTIYDYKSLSFI
jgi:hypothetical protein